MQPRQRKGAYGSRSRYRQHKNDTNDALAILRKNQSTTHVWLPGIGTVNGLVAANYIESTGITPCAINDVTGLALDANGVLGDNKVTNGDFSNGITEWTLESATYSISNGQITLTNTVALNGRINRTIATVAGQSYRINIGIIPGTSGARIFIGTSIYGTQIYSNYGATGTLNFVFTAQSATTFLFIGVTNAVIGQTCTFHSISTKEISGIHLTQPTTANKPKLSKRYNLLTKTEDFSSGWTLNSGTKTPNSTIAPDGTNTATYCDSAIRLYQSFSHTLGSAYRLSFHVKAVDTNSRVAIGNSYGGEDVGFNALTGAVTRTNANYTPSVEVLSNGWMRISVLYTPSVATPYISIMSDSAFGGTSGFYIWGASLIPNNQASLPYQRVNTATDYDTVGFPYKFDMLDAGDQLTATFPAGYESATVIDVVPSGQVTALAQNIVGTYNINTDTNGRFVFRDALSAGDLAIIQAYANKLVGL